jgi:hypothetical protein
MKRRHVSERKTHRKKAKADGQRRRRANRRPCFVCESVGECDHRAKAEAGDIALCNQCEGLIEYASVDAETLTAERVG